jgi:hypothetical protein
VKIAEFPKKSIFALTTHGIEERMLKLNRRYIFPFTFRIPKGSARETLQLKDLSAAGVC